MKKFIFALCLSGLSSCLFASSLTEKKPTNITIKKVENPKVVEVCVTSTSTITGPTGSGISIDVHCTKCHENPMAAAVLASVCASNMVQHILPDL